VNAVARVRLFVKRFLGEDVGGLGFDALMGKYEEARVMREFEVGVAQEAIAKAFSKRK
jgi:hypothetical protein